MSENLVEVKHLQQYFPAGGMGKNKQYVQAVDDVSFAIRKGETLGLVGESGCGKTTTGRTLLRLYEPTDGTIIYDGKVLFDKKKKIAVDMLPYRRRMQIVFQDPYASLDPRMTIGDIVGEGIDIHHLCANAKERHDKIISLLERVGLNSEHANRYPHEFSGGQRQRVGIARGCANHRRHLKHTVGSSSPALAANQRQETVLHGGDTKRTQRRGNLIGRKRREGRRLKIELNGRIGADGRDLAAQQSVIDVRTQVLAHLALDLVSMRDDLVQATVLRNERARLFGADARHAGDVIGRVALQTIKVGHERRRDAVIQIDHALGRHDRHVGQALAGRDHVDVLGHELIHIAITGHQQHVTAGLLAQARHSAQDLSLIHI